MARHRRKAASCSISGGDGKKAIRGDPALTHGLRRDRLCLERSDGGNGRRQSNTSTPQHLVSSGSPTRCQPGNRDFTSDQEGMDHQIRGRKWWPGIAAGERATACGENSCTPQTRLGKTHQTHHTRPAILNLPRQTHLMKSQKCHVLTTRVVSLVSFIRSRLILGRKYHRGWSLANRRSQRISPRRMCMCRRMWRTTSTWRYRWIMSFESVSRRNRRLGSERISFVAMIGATAMSWPSRRQHSTRWCRMWRPTPVSRLKPSEITMLPPSDDASPQGGQRHRQPQERHHMTRAPMTQTPDDVGRLLTEITEPSRRR